MSRRTQQSNKQRNSRRARAPSEDFVGSYNTQDDHFDIVWDENTTAGASDGSAPTLPPESYDEDTGMQAIQPTTGPLTRMSFESREAEFSPSSGKPKDQKNSAAFFAVIDCAMIVDEERSEREVERAAADKRRRVEGATISSAHASGNTKSGSSMPAGSAASTSGRGTVSRPPIVRDRGPAGQSLSASTQSQRSQSPPSTDQPKAVPGPYTGAPRPHPHPHMTARNPPAPTSAASASTATARGLSTSAAHMTARNPPAPTSAASASTATARGLSTSAPIGNPVAPVHNQLKSMPTPSGGCSTPPAVPVPVDCGDEIDDAVLVMAMEAFERSQATTSTTAVVVAGSSCPPTTSVEVARAHAKSAYSLKTAPPAPAAPSMQGEATQGAEPIANTLTEDAELSFSDADFAAMDQLVADALAAKAATASAAVHAEHEGGCSTTRRSEDTVTCIRLVALDILNIPDRRRKELHCTLACPEEAQESSQRLLRVVLTDDWYDTALQVGDVFHVLTLTKAAFDRRKARGFAVGSAPASPATGNVDGLWEIVLTGSEYILVLHPDTLLSPSKISEAANCTRRGVINETVRSLSSSGYQGISSHHALLGTLKHELMEQLLLMYLGDGRSVGAKVPDGCTMSNADRDRAINQKINSIINGNIEQLFSANYPVATARQQLASVVAPLLSLIEQIGRNKRTGGGGVDLFPAVVERMVGSEETKWCPQLGLKGQLDGTAMLRLVGDAGEEAVTVRCPVELKTGAWKPSVVSSHRAQLIFYILMLLIEDETQGCLTLLDTRTQRICNVGLLIYISGVVQADNSSAGQNAQYGSSGSFASNVAFSTTQFRAELVVPQWTEIVALMLIRNKLAAAVNCANDVSNYNGATNSSAPNLLPPMLNSQRECEFCYQAAECMLLHAAVENGNAVSSGAPRLFNHVLKIAPPEQAASTAPTPGFSEQSVHNPTHMQYLRHMLHLVSLEHNCSSAHTGMGGSGSDQHRPANLWTKSSARREKSGEPCVGGLSMSGLSEELISASSTKTTSAPPAATKTTSAPPAATPSTKTTSAPPAATPSLETMVVAIFCKEFPASRPINNPSTAPGEKGVSTQIALVVGDKVFVSIERLYKERTCANLTDIEDLGRSSVGELRQITNICSGRVASVVQVPVVGSDANTDLGGLIRVKIEVSLTGHPSSLLGAIVSLTGDTYPQLKGVKGPSTGLLSWPAANLGRGIRFRLDKDSSMSSVAMLRHNILNLFASHGYNQKEMNAAAITVGNVSTANSVSNTCTLGLPPSAVAGGGASQGYYSNEEVQAHQRKCTVRMRAAIVDLQRIERAPAPGDEFIDSVHLFAPLGFSRITYQKYMNILMKLQSNAKSGVAPPSAGSAFSARTVGQVRVVVFTVVVNSVHITYRVESLPGSAVSSRLKTGSDLIGCSSAIISINRGEFTAYPGCYPWELFREYSSVLNVEQKDAVKKMLRTPDYVLLLGMPGTGKTTVISLAVRALIARGQKVLISSYTHSAVDNLLLKIIQAGVTKDICMRLGSSSSSSAGGGADKGLSAVQPYIFDQNSHLWSSDAAGAAGANAGGICPSHVLAGYLSNIRLVACTVLTAASVKSSVIKLLRLDWSIVDEAGQITQPAILGSLLASGCSKFALIGDFYQLPPLVQSQEAASLGLDVSLFRRLAESHPETVVYLTQQYRMNATIVKIANALIYDNKLKCATPAVAAARLQLPLWEALKTTGKQSTGANNKERALLFCLNPENCVVFVNTDAVRSGLVESNTVNSDEAVIVFQLVQLFKRFGLASTKEPEGPSAKGDGNGIGIGSDNGGGHGVEFMEQIGVISPFRGQVSALIEFFAAQSAALDGQGHIKSEGLHESRDVSHLPYQQLMGTCGGGPAGSQRRGAVGMCEISTVDKYQGRDKDVIILSTVKRVEHQTSLALTGGEGALNACASSSGSAGNLLRDWRRINVAISRAKQKLIILGSVSVMKSVPILRTLVEVMTEM